MWNTDIYSFSRHPDNKISIIISDRFTTCACIDNNWAASNGLPAF